MNVEFPLWQASRPYVCPSDAGPAWREAYEAGMDMAEIEENLRLTLEERLEKHDRKRNDFLQREHFFEIMRQGTKLIRVMLEQQSKARSNPQSTIRNPQ
jgi:hypothetical protein